ncbi:hypothetical protein QR97_13225 [Streptomyces sp. PBH53]|uniref:hypothetical protein n=1 Tax=Streptomyces TaxID=1883 RepID=UPI00065599B6|nr:hypothetical protein [Streptomyces sp. PBH53]AKN75306.1 hypothetical protein QR97_13225 [Streptomyces sp. PBH53]
MAQKAEAQRPTVSERITIALIAKAAEGLQRLQRRTGLSKTDVVNRAISVYDFIDQQLEDGNELLIRRKGTDEVQLVHIL